MKVMWDKDELIKLIQEHGGQITPEKLLDLLEEGDNIAIELNGDKIKISASGGGEITPQALLDIIQGSETIVVDLSEDEKHIEIHLDTDVVSKLDRALLTPISLTEFKLVGVNPVATKKSIKKGVKSANASEQLNLGLDSSLHIDNGKLCSLIPSGNNLPSGRFTGELFILNVDVGQVLKGIYKYNGSLWEKVADIGGSVGQVQSDWNQSDNTKPDYIKNKPTIPSTIHLYSHTIIVSPSGENRAIIHIINNSNNAINFEGLKAFAIARDSRPYFPILIYQNSNYKFAFQMLYNAEQDTIRIHDLNDTIATTFNNEASIQDWRFQIF